MWRLATPPNYEVAAVERAEGQLKDMLGERESQVKDEDEEVSEEEEKTVDVEMKESVEIIPEVINPQPRILLFIKYFQVDPKN